MSKHFVDDNVFLGKEYVGQYGSRLRELDLPAAWANDYGVYAYEPAKGREPAAYWVCRQVVDRCPVCNARYKTDAVASVSESELAHYCKVNVNPPSEKPSYEIRPATLYLRRVRWRCYNCYAQSGKYNARMEDDSKLVSRNEALTLPLKEQLGRWGLYMTTASLARIFRISEPVVKKCITKELAACDKKRRWDDIRTLGLYTVELSVRREKIPCCLCTDVDTQSLIELFAYEDKKAAANFLSSIKNKQNIHQVLTSVDDAACSFAEQNFPDAEIMVDRVDIRKRLLYGLETCKQGNEDSPDFPLLRRHWNLLDNIDAIPPDSKESLFLSSVLDAFPRIAVAYKLKEAGLDIYRADAGQSELIDNWIFSEKYGILPYEQLEQRMILEKNPVLQFAVRYRGTDRQRYEEDVLSVEGPLLRYTDLLCTESSVLGAHVASMQMVRARVLYGAAMMANSWVEQFKANAGRDETNAEYYMSYLSKFTYRPNVVKKTTKTVLEIVLYNFGIPLAIYPMLLRDGLTEYRSTLLDLPPLKKNNNEVKKMPRKMRVDVDDTSKMRDVETYTHDDKKRTNNPPVGMAQHDKAAEKMKTYQYDPHLDPTLQWAGKAEGTSFEVPTSSIHIHESIKPLNIISRVTKEYSKALEGQLEGQLSMFAAETPAERMRRRRESIEFYQHGVDWTNRMIAGDSLVIMNSLIEKEGLSGGGGRWFTSTRHTESSTGRTFSRLLISVM